MVSKLGACLLAVLLATFSFGARGAGDSTYEMEPANNDVSNQASLQRGAKYYVNYCQGCHSAQYVRYNTLAEGLGLTEDQVLENLMFVGEQPHDTMVNARPADDAARWFGQAPPDLSLIARSRGSDYIYNFLKTFYVEEGVPTGVNNMVLENTSMPHVLWELQGIQRAVYAEHEDGTAPEFTGFEMVTPGTLSADDYDQLVRDIVNFLDYIGEPMQMQRRSLGLKVIAFLLVFMLFAYLLKREIWSDVH